MRDLHERYEAGEITEEELVKGRVKIRDMKLDKAPMYKYRFDTFSDERARHSQMEGSNAWKGVQYDN